MTFFIQLFLLLKATLYTHLMLDYGDYNYDVQKHLYEHMRDQCTLQYKNLFIIYVVELILSTV